MSAQEVRSEIIHENVPKLIKCLTDFEDRDENTQRCEQFAWSIIRNHRQLSTNSHAVRRKIEEIQEKLRVDNFADHAIFFGRICSEVIQHPLCNQHYEVDVQWSLLDFLLTLAYNPTGALRRNEYEIDLNISLNAEDIITNVKEMEYWKSLLKQDFIEEVPISSSDSELSAWSDDSSEQCFTDSSSSESEQIEEKKKITKILNWLPDLTAPQKKSPFVLFDNQGANERLFNSVQHSWWLPSINAWQAKVDSDRIEANFAVQYNQFLNESSINVLRADQPSTIEEGLLLRELIWMFFAPQDCFFFSVMGNNISVRENVTIPSVTVNGLATFLQNEFVPYLQLMNVLRGFLKSIYLCVDITPPKTLECYAAGLRLLLEPINKELLAYEKRLTTPCDFQINTLLDLQRTLKPSMETLESIYRIHRETVLNLRQYPAHISSAYSLAALMKCERNATNTREANLSMSLFFAAVRVFCVIIDTWWTEGRLDDWQSEFVIECNADRSVSVRQYSKNKDLAFFVPNSVSKVIVENSFFHLLVEHSLEAGCTLNLLYEINRISDLRSACTVVEGKLYEVFVDEVLNYVHKLQSEVQNDDEIVPPLQPTEKSGCSMNDRVDAACDTKSLQATSKDTTVLQKLCTSDEFLLLALNNNLLRPKETTADVCDGTGLDTVTPKQAPDALKIFTEFEKSKAIIPLTEVVLRCFSRILKTRIAFANSFVMELYRDEFDIQRHLCNIRKVLLLEASDIMHQFYTKLFKQIESGHPWANSSLLTSQLDDIICTKYPDISSMFRVEINSAFRCQTDKVFEAVDELIITYNFSRELLYVISMDDMQIYNKVFKFLLKVKWGLSTLENLSFPHRQKRRKPYATFEMIDLIMRRLEQIRFWMIYAMQNIHSHLMTQVLQSMGEQLNSKINRCQHLKEMETVHLSYISTVCEHCFLVEQYSIIKLGIEQLLNLIFILRQEWYSCMRYIESNRDPLAVCVDDSSNSGYSEEEDNDYVVNSQIDAIESTYIRCHQYLANKLNDEVYLKQRTFLSGLSAAFNTNVPNEANLCLQVLMQLNVYLSSIWALIYGFHILYHLSTLWNIHGLFIILAFIAALSIEWYRLYAGYSGNLKTRTDDLCTFLILSPLIQLPLLLFLVLDKLARNLLIMVPIVSIFVCMAFEMVVGTWTWLCLCNHKKVLYQLRRQMQLHEQAIKFRLSTD